MALPLAKYYRAKKKKIGLIWMDAHGDMNTPETSPSGNIHGMPLAATLGYGPDALSAVGQFKQKVEPDNTVLIRRARSGSVGKGDDPAK